MSIKLDKKVITLEQVEEAKQYAQDNEWMKDSSVIRAAADKVLQCFYEDGYNFSPDLVSKPDLKVSINHYHLTIWCEVVVSYWYDSGEHFARIGMDLVDSYNASYQDDVRACAFVIVFDVNDCRTI